MSNNPPPDVALIARAVLQLGRRLRRAPEGRTVSISALGLLTRLIQEGPRPAADLARLEQLQPQSLTRIIATLEKQGFIERHPHPTDARALIVDVTAEGRDVLARDLEARRRWLGAAMLRVLSPEECSRLEAAADLMLKVSSADLGDSRLTS